MSAAPNGLLLKKWRAYHIFQWIVLLQSNNRVTVWLLSRHDLIQSVFPLPIFLAHTQPHTTHLNPPISFVDRHLPFMWLNVQRGWIGLPKLKHDYRMICRQVIFPSRRMLLTRVRSSVLVIWSQPYLLAWMIHFSLQWGLAVIISAPYIFLHLEADGVFF